MAFQKGQSGNPAGKPKGAKDKRTALRELLQPHAEQLVQKAVKLALDGDTTALSAQLIGKQTLQSLPQRQRGGSPFHQQTSTSNAVIPNTYNAKLDCVRPGGSPTMPATSSTA
ncbi:hypothetical protein KXR69_16090 [Ralstonia holmesii]|nr:hypothetical protein R11007_01576 [Ralstonia sp. LMG 32967]